MQFFKPKKETLGDWAGQAHPPITYDYNAPQLSHVTGCEPVQPVPPPQTLFDLASVPTPFGVLFRKPRTSLT